MAIESAFDGDQCPAELPATVQPPSSTTYYYVCPLPECKWSGSSRARHSRRRPNCSAVPIVFRYRRGVDNVADMARTALHSAASKATAAQVGVPETVLACPSERELLEDMSNLSELIEEIESVGPFESVGRQFSRADSNGGYRPTELPAFPVPGSVQYLDSATIQLGGGATIQLGGGAERATELPAFVLGSLGSLQYLDSAPTELPAFVPVPLERLPPVVADRRNRETISRGHSHSHSRTHTHTCADLPVRTGHGHHLPVPTRSGHNVSSTTCLCQRVPLNAA